MVVAAQVWTYWLSLPLLAAWVLLVVATGVGYYRKVVVPAYLAGQLRQWQQGEPRPPEQLKRRPTRSNDGDGMPVAA